jgi:GMP synthase-like glutamine amidotransferase
MHDHVSPPGPISERLEDRGFSVTEMLVVPEARYASPNVTVEFPAATEWDLIVPLGAPWAADGVDVIGSWLLPELQLLRDAQDADVPVLGICFGGQALACALGGGVERSPRPEIGWVTIETDNTVLVEPGPWFQFHYDRWLLPPGAVEIARNDVASQAFRIGRSLALQFHPELTSTVLKDWLDDDGKAQVEAVGLDPKSLLDLTMEKDADARRRAHRLVDAFLDQVAGYPQD